MAAVLALALPGVMLPGVLLAPPAWAGDVDHSRVRKLVESGEIRPLAELLRRAQEQHQGELLEAEIEEEGGELVYEIELLAPNGEVWEVYFDARSGELLKVARED